MYLSYPGDLSSGLCMERERKRASLNLHMVALYKPHAYIKQGRKSESPVSVLHGTTVLPSSPGELRDCSRCQQPGLRLSTSAAACHAMGAYSTAGSSLWVRLEQKMALVNKTMHADQTDCNGWPP